VHSATGWRFPPTLYYIQNNLYSVYLFFYVVNLNNFLLSIIKFLKN
jgi:hypothetical protein